jgi:hypothetical protein
MMVLSSAWAGLAALAEVLHPIAPPVLAVPRAVAVALLFRFLPPFLSTTPGLSAGVVAVAVAVSADRYRIKAVPYRSLAAAVAGVAPARHKTVLRALEALLITTAVRAVLEPSARLVTVGRAGI